MEKQQTTPAGYPMTLNSLRGACNQKTNRDPVTDLGAGAIRDALETLRKDVLVWRSAGARVEHWEHRLASRWGLDEKAQAVVTLLILRGTQTPGELRTRSERMAQFETVDDVVRVLRGLAEGEHPIVSELSRAPGQRESRWRHLAGLAADGAPQPGSSELHKETVTPGHLVAKRVDDERLAALEVQVADLEQRLRFLERELT